MSFGWGFWLAHLFFACLLSQFIIPSPRRLYQSNPIHPKGACTGCALAVVSVGILKGCYSSFNAKCTSSPSIYAELTQSTLWRVFNHIIML